MPTAALTAFVACAFLGWLLEAIWLWSHRERVIRGPLHPLPFKPIYGFGGALIVLAAPWVAALPLAAQWAAFAVLLGAFEAVGGVVSERVFGRRLWRYDRSFLNVRGYTDAFHAAVWGVLGVVIMRLV